MNEAAHALDPQRLRVRLDAARAQLGRDLGEGRPGRTLTADFSHAIRSLLAEAAEASVRGWDPGRGRLCVVEIGSIARDQLCPHADVDLVVLCERSHGEDEAFARWMRGLLHPLWDGGVKIKSVVQTPAGWLEGCVDDLSQCTALLDARPLAGDTDLLTSTQQAHRERYTGDRRLGTLLRLRRDMERRFVHGGGTVLRNEPDLKTGAGGTRDLASLRWAFIATYGTADHDELVARGVLRKRSARLLGQAQDVITRLRCGLHLVAGRSQDRLVFQYQDDLGGQLGLAADDAGDEDIVRAVETFMQQFHEAASVALRFGRREFRRCLPPRLGPRLDRRIDERFRAVDHRLVYDGQAAFAESPALALQALAIARDHGISVGARAVDAITEGSEDPRAARLSGDPEAHRWFLNLLTDPSDAGRPTPLERCHEYGLLERVVPEFAPCRGRMQYESFHAFTVDQHSLYVVEFLKALVRGEFRKDYPLATAVHLGVDDPRALYLAALLHDAGKPHGDQCEIGASLAAEVATRLGFSTADAARVSRLVELHLEMPSLSQRRDLSDPALIREFAGQVGERRLLSELYLLSLADMAAVGPDYLTSWKATLLDELYLLTAAVLSGEVHRRSLGQRTRDDEPEGMPERYYALFDLTMRQAHRVMVDHVRRGDASVALDVRTGAGGLLRLTVAAQDQRGLLAHIAAQLDEMGLEVLAADLFPVPGDPRAALDVFRVGVRAGHELHADAEWTQRMETRLTERLARHERFEMPSPLPRPRRSGRRRGGDCEIRFDVDPRRERTIVEIETDDQPGVMRRIAQAFAICEVEIELARLMTEGPRVLDIFYVTRLDPKTQAVLERQIRAYLKRAS